MEATNVQAHGDDFENEIHLAVHGKTKKEYEKLIKGGHIAELDIKKGVLADFNGSVKATKTNSVGGGDIIRQYKGTKVLDIIFIIGKYNQITKKIKEYDKIYEFYINPTHWDLLWSGIQLDTLENFDSYVKSIPRGKEAQLAHQDLWKEKRENIYEKEDRGLMSINAKIDSKGQRRVQCGFNIKEMIKADIPHKIFTEEYRGISLPYFQESGPRTFN